MAAKAKMESVVWDEKRKEFVDLSRGQDVRPLWQRDEEVGACPVCLQEFSLFKRRVGCSCFLAPELALTPPPIASLSLLWQNLLCHMQ